MCETAPLDGGQSQFLHQNNSPLLRARKLLHKHSMHQWGNICILLVCFYLPVLALVSPFVCLFALHRHMQERVSAKRLKSKVKAQNGKHLRSAIATRDSVSIYRQQYGDSHQLSCGRDSHTQMKVRRNKDPNFHSVVIEGKTGVELQGPTQDNDASSTNLGASVLNNSTTKERNNMRTSTAPMSLADFVTQHITQSPGEKSWRSETPHWEGMRKRFRQIVACRKALKELDLIGD